MSRTLDASARRIPLSAKNCDIIHCFGSQRRFLHIVAGAHVTTNNAIRDVSVPVHTASCQARHPGGRKCSQEGLKFHGITACAKKHTTLVKRDTSRHPSHALPQPYLCLTLSRVKPPKWGADLAYVPQPATTHESHGDSGG